MFFSQKYFICFR